MEEPAHFFAIATRTIALTSAALGFTKQTEFGPWRTCRFLDNLTIMITNDDAGFLSLAPRLSSLRHAPS